MVKTNGSIRLLASCTLALGLAVAAAPAQAASYTFTMTGTIEDVHEYTAGSVPGSIELGTTAFTATYSFQGDAADILNGAIPGFASYKIDSFFATVGALSFRAGSQSEISISDEESGRGIGWGDAYRPWSNGMTVSGGGYSASGGRVDLGWIEIAGALGQDFMNSTALVTAPFDYTGLRGQNLGYSFSAATGDFLLRGDIESWEATAGAGSPVPLPAPVLLLGSGLAGLAALGRRGRRR